MFGRFGWAEILVIVVLVVILFGSNKIPGMMKNLADGLNIFKKEIKDVKVKIKTLEREERAEENLERKIALQEEIASLERKKRRLRQEIFDVEDEIEDERKTLIDALKQHLNAKISTQHLFTFKWKLC